MLSAVSAQTVDQPFNFMFSMFENCIILYFEVRSICKNFTRKAPKFDIDRSKVAGPTGERSGQ